MISRRFARAVAGCAVAVASLLACGDADRLSPHAPEPRAPAAHPPERDLSALRAFEDTTRAAVAFDRLPPSNRALGPDPYRVVALPGTTPPLAAGILRGASAVVLLDADAREIQRLPAPPSPSGIAVTDRGEILVAGEGTIYHPSKTEKHQLGELYSHIAVYQRGADAPALKHVGTLGLRGSFALREIAVGPGRVLYAADDYSGRVLAIPLAAELRHPRPDQPMHVRPRLVGSCHGPLHVRVAGAWLAVNCVLDRALDLYRLDPAGTPIRPPVRIQHDGPLWSLDLAALPSGDLLVAAGGVEDHPLVREDGAFHYVDSFAYLYRARPGRADAERLAAVNTSEHGAITPRWISIVRQPDSASFVLRVAGYGGDRALTLTWPGGVPSAESAAPVVTTRQVVPGTTSAAALGDALVLADPLFDAWVVARADADNGDEGAVTVVPVSDPGPPPEAAVPPRSPQVRIGEALFFTHLMAPWNQADGRDSRFTCETCHFEGYADGRTHYTGRTTVHATTKPLLGLFNNRPHFSRALDPTLADMVNNEFNVANKNSGRDAWFALNASAFPWLAHIPGVPDRMSPVFLRRALMSFLMVFTHRPNPAAAGRERFTAREHEGAAVFRDRCERCHRARLIADVPGSQVAFDRWETLILSPEGAIVWGDPAYQKTGVTPYVYEKGTRTPSLRRLYKKYPYFTNGAARSVDDVLARVAWAGEAFYHDAAPSAPSAPSGDEHARTAGVAAPPPLERLDQRERAALRAFLALL